MTRSTFVSQRERFLCTAFFIKLLTAREEYIFKNYLLTFLYFLSCWQ